jgi:DNA-binding XRE family transcriptional regulator
MIKLKVFRASRNLTGEDMAKVLGVTPPAYYNMEKGKTDIKVKHIRLIREAFNLSVIEVLDLFEL